MTDSTKNSFSLIEVLVVVTIISVLAATVSVSYSQFNKQSRDARRKSDVENMRAALEMYKSNSQYNSYPVSLPTLIPNYINSLPNDPKTALPYPTYSPSPVGCDETATTCINYTVSVALETGGNYQANSYGASVVVPTSTSTPSPTPP